MDKKLNLHENALITSIAWNEKETKLATSDNKGLVFISSTDTGKWVRNLVNDSSRSAVVTATWSPDASRILMVYVNGLVMLGTASGHRIYNGTINKGSASKFGLIASASIELFVLGWGMQFVAIILLERRFGASPLCWQPMVTIILCTVAGVFVGCSTAYGAESITGFC